MYICQSNERAKSNLINTETLSAINIDSTMISEIEIKIKAIIIKCGFLSN